MKLKYAFIILVTSSMFFGCAQKKKNQQVDIKKDYNHTIYSIVEAHGGMDQWNKQQTLSFEMGNQKHTIDLKSRQIKITSPAFAMGSDGKKVWIKQDADNFKGSPTFYHSLMFYFHTMPFVLADDGINYQPAADKEIKGTNYKALKMTFNDDIGDAPKDEYIIYYHPDTQKMEWLAYTSTYRTQKKSDHFGLIHYTNWKETNNLLLPTKLQWFQYEDGKVGDPQGNARIFTHTNLSEKKMDADFYAMPEGALVDSASVQ